MDWNPFKKVEQFVSDIGKSVEKTVSDVWESDIGKAAIIAPVAIVAAPAVLPVLGGAATVAGGAASGILGGVAGLAKGAVSVVGGGISAVTGLGGAPVTVAEQMAAIAEPGYYGVSAATGLSTIMKAVGAGAGIYGQLAQIEAMKEMTEAQKIAAQSKLMEAEALKIYAAGPSAIPTLAAGTTQPVYVTPAAAPGKPNILLYAALAFVAFMILRKK